MFLYENIGDIDSAARLFLAGVNAVVDQQVWQNKGKEIIDLVEAGERIFPSRVVEHFLSSQEGLETSEVWSDDPLEFLTARDEKFCLF